MRIKKYYRLSHDASSVLKKELFCSAVIGLYSTAVIGAFRRNVPLWGPAHRTLATARSPLLYGLLLLFMFLFFIDRRNPSFGIHIVMSLSTLFG